MEDFEKAGSLMAQSLEAYRNGDYETGDRLRSEANRLYDSHSLSMDVQTSNFQTMYNEGRMFGVIHRIMEENAPELFKTKEGKRTIARYINMVKGNKVLKEQYDLFNAMLKMESVEGIPFNAMPSLDEKTVMNENRKVIRFFEKNGINEDIEFDSDFMLFCEGLHNIMTRRNSWKGVGLIKESLENVNGYLDNHKDELSVSGDSKRSGFRTIDELYEHHVGEVDRKYRMLNEDERRLVDEICDFNGGLKEERRKGIFEKCRNELVDAIDSVLSDSEGEVKERLSRIREAVMEKKYDSNTLMKDVSEMLQMKDTLTM